MMQHWVHWNGFDEAQLQQEHDFTRELQLWMDAFNSFTDEEYGALYMVVQTTCSGQSHSQLAEWAKTFALAMDGLCMVLQEVWEGHCQGIWQTDPANIITVFLLVDAD